jgi:menaquinone-dependent protoporphyrinogen oxidase
MRGKCNMKTMTRRQFVAAGAVAAGGLISMGAVQPGIAMADEIQLIESECKKEGEKYLVAYESNCGSTSGVAQAIADVICGMGASVDVRHVGNVGDVSTYAGVVIGSAVKSASWYPGAIRFVKDNQNNLRQIPVIYFLTCLALYNDTHQTRERAQSYFNPVLKSVPEVRPKAMEAFAGALDYNKLNMVVRMIMKSKMEKQGIPEGDFRDFQKINLWAENTVFPALTKV